MTAKYERAAARCTWCTCHMLYNAGAGSRRIIAGGAAARRAPAARHHAPEPPRAGAPRRPGQHLPGSAAGPAGCGAGAQEGPPDTARDADAVWLHARLCRRRPSRRPHVVGQIDRRGRGPSRRPAGRERLVRAGHVAVARQQPDWRRRDRDDRRRMSREQAGPAQGALALEEPGARQIATPHPPAGRSPSSPRSTLRQRPAALAFALRS